jgi:SAM-dependent methyltransferase
MVIKTLNERALKLLQLIHENDYLTFEDMVLFFGSSGRASEYLSYFKKMNLVEELYTNLRPRKAYCISVWGYNFLQEELRRSDKRFTVQDYNFRKFPHQNMCTKVRIILEKHPAVKDFRPQKVAVYLARKSGKEVYTKGWKEFDSEMVVEKDGKEYIIGVEIELTQKSSESYAKRFLNIDTSRQDVKYVAWFCGSKTTMNMMLKIINNMQLKDPLKHKFCLLDEFLKKWFQTEWVDVEGPLLFMSLETEKQNNKGLQH